MNIKELLEHAHQSHASDLFLYPDSPPVLRIAGELEPMNLQPLTSDNIEKIIFSVMTEEEKQRYRSAYEIDFSCKLANVGRLRVNCFRQYAGSSAVFRLIPELDIGLKEIGAPSILRDVINMTSGLVLVAGATGSGKTTTLSALIQEINQVRKAHIISIEQPIERVYENDQCLISQRAVGQHTRSFSDALRSALRESPDIIVVSEMRDLDSIRLALSAAETGHLVLATVHTSSAIQTVDRIIDSFPGDEASIIRSLLASSIQAIVCQMLLKRKQSNRNDVLGERIMACEVLVATPAVKTLIRDNNPAQLYSIMQTGSELGMHTLDQDLRRLVDEKTVSEAVALPHVVHRDTFGAIRR